MTLSEEEAASILLMRIPAETPATSNIIPVKKVDEKVVLKETKTFDLKTQLKDRFTLTSVGNRPRFEQLDRILRTNHLYTMAKKLRLKPVTTLENRLVRG